MTIKSKYSYEESVYVKNDPEQLEYIVVGIIGRPGSISLELSRLGDLIELYEFEVCKDKDELKYLGVNKKEEEED